MGRAGSRLSRLARVRHHPRRTAFTGRPAPHPARPTNPTPPTELTTEPPNRHHTNRIRRHRIASQGAGPTSGHIYTGNGTPPHGGKSLSGRLIGGCGAGPSPSAPWTRRGAWQPARRAQRPPLRTDPVARALSIAVSAAPMHRAVGSNLRRQ